MVKGKYYTSETSVKENFYMESQSEGFALVSLEWLGFIMRIFWVFHVLTI